VYVPVRLWQREPVIPSIEQHLCWRDELGESLYQLFVRPKLFATTTIHALRSWPGRSGYCRDRLADCRHERAAQIYRMVRRVFYFGRMIPATG